MTKPAAVLMLVVAMSLFVAAASATTPMADMMFDARFAAHVAPLLSTALEQPSLAVPLAGLLGTGVGSQLQLPLHGAYCGYGVSGNNFQDEPVDRLDELCRTHDQCYATLTSSLAACDSDLLQDLDALLALPDAHLGATVTSKARFMRSVFEAIALANSGATRAVVMDKLQEVASNLLAIGFNVAWSSQSGKSKFSFTWGN